MEIIFTNDMRNYPGLDLFHDKVWRQLEIRDRNSEDGRSQADLFYGKLYYRNMILEIMGQV